MAFQNSWADFIRWGSREVRTKGRLGGTYIRVCTGGLGGTFKEYARTT